MLICALQPNEASPYFLIKSASGSRFETWPASPAGGHATELTKLASIDLPRRRLNPRASRCPLLSGRSRSRDVMLSTPCGARFVR
jgi:hypothetical protein